MKIWMIWAQDAGATWLVAAWDDATRAESAEEWDSDLAEAIHDYGVDGVRVLTTEVAMRNVEAAFEPSELVNTGITKEATE